MSRFQDPQAAYEDADLQDCDCEQDPCECEERAERDYENAREWAADQARELAREDRFA